MELLGLDIPLIPEPERACAVQQPVELFPEVLDNAQSVDPKTVPAPREPVTPWPAKLPLDLALGAEPPEQILLRHNVDLVDYTRWTQMPAFRRALAEAAKDVHEQGLSFKLQCQGIAQDFLEVIDQHMHDDRTGFALKMDAFKTVTKLAGLEQKDLKDGAGTGAMVNIQINL